MKNDPREDIDFLKTSKFDVILIVLILLFSVGYIFWVSLNRGQQSSASTKAEVYLADNLLEQVELSEDKIIALPNGKMDIEIKNGRIRVLRSDCPQQLCVHMGWIQYSGQTIVCVPNKILIEVKSEGPAFLDTVVY